MPKTLLLVDDDEDLLVGMSSFLTQKGYGVLTATSGEEGLKVARERQPDLLVLDVRMPGMSGYALCAALKQEDQTFDTPVIFLSAYGEAGDMLRGYYAGAHDYMVKPMDKDELLRKILHLIGS